MKKPPLGHHPARKALQGVLATFALGAGAASAADIQWNGTTGPFSAGGNWVGGNVPGAGDIALVTNGGTAQIGSGSFSLQRLTLGGQTGTGSLEISGGTLAVTNGGHNAYIGGSDTAGSTGTGTLTISGGAVNASGGEFLIGSKGGTGTVNISGSGVLSNNNWIIFGRDGGGTGNANLSGSGQLNMTGTGDRHIAIGIFSGTTSTVTATDNSSITSNNEIRVGWGDNGNATKGVLDLSGNATAHSNGDFNVAHTQGGANGPTGELKLSGNASASTNARFQIGLRGGANGTLTMSGTSTASAGNEFYIGSEQGATGTLTMGDSSKITVTNGFVVGRFNSTGLATVNGNAEIAIGGVNVVGDGPPATGTLVVNGNAYVHSNSQLWLGLNQSTSTVTINGGRVVANPVLDPLSGLYDATGAGVSFSRFGSGAGNGTLNLNGGALETPGFSRYNGANVQINLNGGTIKATGMTTTGSFFDNITSAQINVQAGGAKFDTNGNNITVVQNLAGVGGLTKQGAGSLTLTGANAYLGATVISAGTLTLGASERIADVSAVTLAGGTLNLNNFNETLAALTLGSSSTIDFGGVTGGNSVAFANSSAIGWTGILTLANFELGSDNISFSAAGLTAQQLAKIQFTIGDTLYQGIGFDGNNVTFQAVPEPADVGFAIAGVLAFIAFQRARARRLEA